MSTLSFLIQACGASKCFYKTHETHSLALRACIVAPVLIPQALPVVLIRCGRCRVINFELLANGD